MRMTSTGSYVLIFSSQWVDWEGSGSVALLEEVCHRGSSKDHLGDKLERIWDLRREAVINTYQLIILGVTLDKNNEFS